MTAQDKGLLAQVYATTDLVLILRECYRDWSDRLIVQVLRDALMDSLGVSKNKASKLRRSLVVVPYLPLIRFTQGLFSCSALAQGEECSATS